MQIPASSGKCRTKTKMTDRFKAKDFLLTKKQFRRNLEHWDKMTELRLFFDDLNSLDLLEVINQLSIDTEEDRVEVIKTVILLKLGIGFNFDYLLDRLESKFIEVDKQLAEIAKYKDHRHKTMLGLYTEKSVY